MEKVSLSLVNFVVRFPFSMAVNAFGGVVLKDFWKWFGEPVFGVPLSWGQAVGLITLKSLFFMPAMLVIILALHKESESKDGGKKSWALLILIALGYLYAWGVGFIWAKIIGVA